MWDFSSLTRDQTQDPCTGNTESLPLNDQGRKSPTMDFHGMIVSFFLLMNILLSRRTSLLIHETTKGNLACFHVLTIMNKASKNTLVQVLLWTCFWFIGVNTKE